MNKYGFEVEMPQFSIGKEINCHLGYFVLPTEIYEVCIQDDLIAFRCEDGIYEANAYSEVPFKIKKVLDD